MSHLLYNSIDTNLKLGYKSKMKNNNDMGETEKSLNDVENESKFIDDKLEGGAVGDERDLHDKLSEGRKYDRPNSNKVQELVAYVSFQSFVFF